MLLPGALTAYLAFNEGGFFVDGTALAALVLAVALLLRVTLAEEPFDGLTVRGSIAIAALALYATWVLASFAWSGAPGRALLEFDRVLLYLLALGLFASVRWRPAQLRWMLAGVAGAIVAVCAVGLISRALPQLVTAGPTTVPSRLSHPLGYWNALGLLAALGLVLCLHLTSSNRAHTALRVLSAGAMPLLAATLLLTFSRGAIAVLVLAVPLYVLLARPRALPGALLATFAPVWAALKAVYDADLLATSDPTTVAARAQGAHLAVVVAVGIAVAIVLRLALLPLDRRLARAQLPRWRPSPAMVGATAVAAVIAAAVLALALDIPGQVDRQYQRFVTGGATDQEGPLRERLTDTSNNGRLDNWTVALDQWERSPLAGRGAGTFALTWAQQRPSEADVQDAHSLYLESLSELGVTGLLLLAVALGTIFAALALRCRGTERALYAAVIAAGVAWAVRAGLDWDWEVPAVTLWLFALGGAGLAAVDKRGEGAARSAGMVPAPGRMPRVLLGLACAVIAVTPALTFVSQRRLNQAVGDLKGGDCAGAVDAALGSLDALRVRSGPYEVLGYCDARFGDRRLAVEALETAIERDPQNWELYYGLSLVRGAFGLDPRRAAFLSLILNPNGALPREAVAMFQTDDPRKWERRARSARLPIP